MGDLLQGAGLFICVGAVVLVLLAVVGFRAIFAGRNRNQSVIDETVTEQPRFDDSGTGSTGGFSGVPTTGGVRQYDSDREEEILDDELDRRRRAADDDDSVPPVV